jgi:pyruvate,water dikinase
MSVTIGFHDAGSCDPGLVGGKGANLGRLVQAGFHVPRGFTVSTEAYGRFLEESGLMAELHSALDLIDYEDVTDLEARTAGIRELITSTAMPDELAAEITRAYEQLGSAAYVAVRSSGTAEDLADASFAGLHDTFLDVRQADEVLAAIKKCWASLWTARATAYRQRNSFNHHQVRIAVVVQTMVESEVAGVMFTGHPISAATDELVINASWGLGESIVAGVVTPDEYVVRAADLSIKQKSMGAKRSSIVRDADAGNGTRTEPVSQDRQDAFSLTDEQVVELAELGRRVQRHYDSIPQDIEWALADGMFHLLQSRPITGVDFSWDSDLDPPQLVADHDTTVWTRAWADEVWTGAITPLFYTTRGWAFSTTIGPVFRTLGCNEAALLKPFRYHRGTAYYNTDVEKTISRKMIWPAARAHPLNWGGLSYIEPAAHEEIASTPFNWPDWSVMQIRLQLHKATAWYGSVKMMYEKYINNPRWDPERFPAETLPGLSDEALIAFILRYLEEEVDYVTDVWVPFWHLRDATNLLTFMIEKWYTGDNPAVLGDLMTGSPGQCATRVETHALWTLSERIRQSTLLRTAFIEHQGPAFFEGLEDHDEGREFLREYRQFVQKHGHRGHADRDYYYPRRAEDLWIDYRNFQGLLSGESTDPEEREAANTTRRNDAVAAVLANLRGQTLGFLKAPAFEVVIGYVHKWLLLRDDERASLDRHTYNARRLFLEVGRRLNERGLLDEPRDFFFLGKHELFEVLRGHANMKLARAKISGRKKHFDLYHNREVTLPPYLKAGEAFHPAGVQDDEDPLLLRGHPQSGGMVRGTARVIRRIEEIGRLKRGDILVCNSTDPGWAAAFSVMGGIVTETGGVLSHAACLSREFGIPAVQVINALQRIPDGTVVRINGDTGEVLIEDAGDEPSTDPDTSAVPARNPAGVA